MDYKSDDGILRSMVDKKVAKCYKDWKSDLYDHFKSAGGAQNEAGARNNPSPPSDTLKNTEYWGKCCVRCMSDAFQVILNLFTILLFVIYLNLNFTNTLYIY